MYLGNMVFGLGGTQNLSLPMLTVLRRFSILMTMIGKQNFYSVSHYFCTPKNFRRILCIESQTPKISSAVCLPDDSGIHSCCSWWSFIQSERVNGIFFLKIQLAEYNLPKFFVFLIFCHSHFSDIFLFFSMTSSLQEIQCW